MRITYKIGVCAKCKLSRTIVHKSFKLCWLCNEKRKTKLYAERRKEKAKQGKVVDKAEMAKFLKAYWAKYTDRRCYETDENLYYYKSYYIHHLLFKQKYPQFAFKEDNLVYLSHFQHALYHSLTEREREEQFPKTTKRLYEIRKKYLGN